VTQPIALPWRAPRLLSTGSAMALMVVGGFGLRLIQYLGNPDLWVDELAIADNVISRPAWVLLTARLMDDQVAPPGFLLLSRLAVVLFGPSEYSLRLFPLLASFAAVGLFAHLAWRILAPWPAVLATTLFSLTPGVALYAAEAKPYGTDMLVTLIVTSLALRWREAPTRGAMVGLAVGGVVSLAFSYTAVFVLAGIGAALLLFTPRSERRPVLSLGLVWAAASALSIGYARTRMDPGLRDFMHTFWRQGFMPWPPASASDLLWAPTALRNLFGHLLEYPWSGLYAVLAGLGFVSLLRRRREASLLLALPVLLALAAAVVHAYPFLLRLALFTIPALLVFAAEGAGWLGALVRIPALANVGLVALAIPAVLDLWRRPPVWRRDEVSSMFAQLQQQRRPGDAVYAAYSSWLAVHHYGPEFGLPLDSVDLGNCYADLRDLLRELDAYRGRPRVWFVGTFERGRGERQAMLDYLDAIGVRKAALEGLPTNRPGATARGTRLVGRARNFAYLYDLSDPQRLASITAESSQLPARPEGLADPCTHGPVIPRFPTIPRAGAPRGMLLPGEPGGGARPATSSG
jgi:hypothetical protein